VLDQMDIRAEELDAYEGWVRDLAILRAGKVIGRQ
jgi:hypothetical protein